MSSPRDLVGQGSDERPTSKPPDERRASAGLVIVATPIGNAGDIGLRALDVLRRADVIACEDTRVTGPLMARYGIATPLVAYHEHNAPRMRPVLLARLARGETIALVSDAGTPLVSDPGYKLVRAAIEAGLPVGTVPGASAAMGDKTGAEAHAREVLARAPGFTVESFIGTLHYSRPEDTEHCRGTLLKAGLPA